MPTRPPLWLACALMTQAACLNLGTAPEGAADSTGTITSPTTVATPSGDGATDGGGTEPGTGVPATAVPGTTTPASSGNGGTTTPVGQPAGNSNTVPVVVAPPPAATVPVTGLARYTLVGRYDTRNPNALTMYYLGSKIGASFTGTSLAVNLADSGTDGLNIVIDGVAMPPLQLQASAMQLYPLATGLNPGLHTVWITKRDEFQQGGNGLITFSGFVIDADADFFAPPKAKPRRIEVVADSSLAGYGVECLCRPGVPGNPGGYRPQTQNADLSIGAQVGLAVNAEVWNLSWSGKGVVESQYDKNPAHMLPVIYPQTFENVATPLWDFSQAPMDVVLISAGSNDVIGSSGSGSFTDVNKFISTYAKWLTYMRGNYPNATLVAMMSPNAKGADRTKLTDALNAAITMAGGAQKDPNMLFFDWFANDPNGWTMYDDVAAKGNMGWGCNYHSSTAGSKWLADRLAPVLKAHMKW